MREVKESLLRDINPEEKVAKKIGAGQKNCTLLVNPQKAGLYESAIEGVSGHSIRVGAAQDLLNSGASMPIIMQRGRWSKNRYSDEISGAWQS